MNDWIWQQDADIEVERYELHEILLEESAPASISRTDGSLVSRRELLAALGAGVFVLCLAPVLQAQEQGRGRPGGAQAPREIGAWIHIGEDGRVTAFSGKTEVGQNVRTMLAMVVAEELRMPVSAVNMTLADTELVPYDAGTFGSQSTPRMVPILREAAAAAREMLLETAAAEWQVDKATLSVADGAVLHHDGRRRAEYGQLTKGRKLARTIRTEVERTPVSQWKVAGHPALKVNARDIVTGAHKYTSDIARPGMLYGKIVRSDAANSTLISADTTRAETVPGVKVVHEKDLIGVVAPTQHAANRACELIKADWRVDKQVSGKELFAHLKSSAQDSGGRGDYSVGDVSVGLAGSDVKVSAEYTIAYIAHAPLEPRAAVAEWNGENVTVWTGTQRPFGVRQELARAFGIPEQRVRVIVPDTGSGYGGKHTGEAAVEAARLAKAAGKPVKLVWTREEEFRWAYFRPAGVIEVHAGASKEGVLQAWEFHNYNSGGSAIRCPYEAPNQKIQFHGSQSPLRQGSYRGLAATANNFARECHIDDLARSVKMDPLAFRLKNLKEPRMRAVLQAAAEKFGWGIDKRRAGHGVGIACGTEKGSFVATCAEIELEPGGRSGGERPRFKVVRAVTAFECGAVINPVHLENQIEGCVLQGLGGALFEEIQFENGRLSNPRFSRYRVPRFADVPAIETVLVDRKDLPSAGAGETPIIGIAPAIGNAVVDACGVRMRSMPMQPG